MNQIVSRRIALLALITVTLALTACSGGGGSTPPQVNSVTITNVPSPAEVGVEQTIDLNASVSVSGGASQEVTWSSSDENVATVDSNGVVVGVAPGDATITATSKADPSKSSSVVITVGATASCGDPIEVSRHLYSNETWEDVYENPDCTDYLVTAGIATNAHALIIEPGVVAAFAKDTGLTVVYGGALTAVGTKDKPIVFTGADKERGYWQGIEFYQSDSDQNMLEYVTVEYGGSATDANVTMRAPSSGSRVSIINSTLRQSAGYGLWQAWGGTVLSAFANNTVTENAQGAARTYAHYAHMLEESSSYTGNDQDVVAVDAFNIGQDQTVTWQNLGVPYRILQERNTEAFRVNGELTLDPGVTILFEEGMGFYVTGGLSAVGTVEKRITLTGAEKRRGYWRGLYFRDTTNQSNRLNYVTIEYGGSTAYSITDGAANLAVAHHTAPSSFLAVDNTILRESGGYGLYARFNTVFGSFTGNTLTQNALGPAYVYASIAHYLASNNSYSGNSTDQVSVAALTIREDVTWHDIGVPFVILKSNNTEAFTISGASFTLEPGIDIRFQADMGLLIRRSGENVGSSLTAVGTQENPITLTGDDAQWKGILIDDSTGTFAHIEIRDGGSAAYATEPGNVTLRTFLGGEPSATASFGQGVSQSGAKYGLVFGPGDTFAGGCLYMAPVYTPSDGIEHCR